MKRVFYEKLHVLIKYFAALRRSVGLLGQFVTVWKNWTGHKHNQLLYPAAHACQRLIKQWLLHIYGTYIRVQQLLLHTSHHNIAMTTKGRAIIWCGFTTTTLPMFWLKKHQQLHNTRSAIYSRGHSLVLHPDCTICSLEWWSQRVLCFLILSISSAKEFWWQRISS